MNNTSTGESKTEAYIDGQWVIFHACSRSSLEWSKKYYADAFTYIGSSRKIRVNDIVQSGNDLHYLFKRKTTE